MLGLVLNGLPVGGAYGYGYGYGYSTSYDADDAVGRRGWLGRSRGNGTGAPAPSRGEVTVE
jgi:hypothetical protein